MLIRQISATGLTALALLAVAACSSSDGGTATVPSDAGLVVYAGPGIKFDKTDYIATAGHVKLAYLNHDAQRHSLAIVNDAKTVVGGELVVSSNGELDVGEYDLPAGDYILQCLVPGHEAMKSKLVVK